MKTITNILTVIATLIIGACITLMQLRELKFADLNIWLKFALSVCVWIVMLRIVVVGLFPGHLPTKLRIRKEED